MAPVANGDNMSYSDLFIYASPAIPKRIYIVGNTQSPSPWEEIIRQKAKEAGLEAEKVVRIAKCESGFKPSIKNANSTASGLFQYLDSTWKSMSAKYGITTQKNDPYGQIELTIKILVDGGWGHWNASRSCWDN